MRLFMELSFKKAANPKSLALCFLITWIFTDSVGKAEERRR